MEALVLRRVVPPLLVLLLMLPNVAAAAAPCWQSPVDARVVDPFREPSCPYCAGNRGLEYSAVSGSGVRSVAAGTVSWSGTIAGVRWVVVEHVDGWRATYGRLAASELATGDRVESRQLIGTTTAEFYFGLRHGERYVDPSPHLARLVGRPRLVPVGDTSARPAPPPRWSCGVHGVAGSRPR